MWDRGDFARPFGGGCLYPPVGSWSFCALVRGRVPLSPCGIVEFLCSRSGEGISLFNNLRGIDECLRGRLGDSVLLFRLRGRER
jgi:hypothetical protein